MTHRRAIESAKGAVLKEVKDERLAAERAASDSLVERFNEPGTPNFPTVQDVLNSNLPRTDTEHFIRLIEDRNSGKDIAAGVATVETNLLARVHDPSHERPITDVAQLVPFINKGLSMPVFETLRGDIDRKNAPATKAREKVFSNFLIASRAKIVQASIIPGKDAVGMDRFKDFQILARQMWLDGLAAGKTPAQLTLTESPDSIGKIISSFQVPITDKLREFTSSLLGNPDAASAVPSVGGPPGETIEQALKRRRDAGGAP